MTPSLSLSDAKSGSLGQITTKELADQLGTDKKVIIENARKFLPNKVFEHGRQTFWTKEEVTVLIEGMRQNNSNQHREKGSVTGAVTVASTDLTPALRIKRAMEMMQEAYEEELAIIKARALEAERVVAQIADGSGCYTMSQTAKALKLPYGNIRLFERLRSLGILNHDNTPKQEQVNNGNFRVVVKHVNEKVGNKPVTLVTGKGLVYLSRRLDAEIDKTVQPDEAEA